MAHPQPSLASHFAAQGTGPGGVDQAYKAIFEDNIEELVKNINVFDQNAALINGLLANEMQVEQL